MRIETFLRFRQDETGAVAVIVALLMTVLIGFVAIGVDMASLYRERAQLQNISDLTAMSAAADTDLAESRANLTLERNGLSSTNLTTIELGRYLRNPLIAASERFTPLQSGDAGINAVRVVLSKQAPLHFARVFAAEDEVALTRTALASRTGAASFSLGSYIAQLDLSVLSQLILGELGVALSAGDLQVLVETSISAEQLLNDVANLSGLTSRNPADILDQTVSAADLIAALDEQNSSSLSALEAALGGTNIAMSGLISGADTALGLTVANQLTEINLTAFDVLAATLTTVLEDRTMGLDLSFGLGGLVSLDTTLSTNSAPAHSGWIALGETGTQLSRSAVTIQSDIELDASTLSGLGASVEVAEIHIPLYTEIAGATATLDEIGCQRSTPNALAARFLTAPTPLNPANGTAVAALYLGQFTSGMPDAGTADPSALDFADFVDINLVISVPLAADIRIDGITIQARSHVTVGTSQTETITFTHRDVADGDTVRSFGSAEMLTTAVTSLLSSENTEIRISPDDTSLISTLAAPIVADALAALPAEVAAALVAPVDAVLDETLSTLGLELGSGELTLTGHHCELIRLVR